MGVLVKNKCFCTAWKQRAEAAGEKLAWRVVSDHCQ
jgi:hypothetical protein